MVWKLLRPAPGAVNVGLWLGFKGGVRVVCRVGWVVTPKLLGRNRVSDDMDYGEQDSNIFGKAEKFTRRL